MSKRYGFMPRKNQTLEVRQCASKRHVEEEECYREKRDAKCGGLERLGQSRAMERSKDARKPIEALQRIKNMPISIA